MASHFKGTGHIVRFIEFMDVGTLNGWDRSQVVTGREIVDRDYSLAVIAARWKALLTGMLEEETIDG